MGPLLVSGQAAGRMAAALSIRAARSASMTSPSSSDMCTPADQVLAPAVPACWQISDVRMSMPARTDGKCFTLLGYRLGQSPEHFH